MGSTITLPAILTALQNNCGCTSEEVAEFIHALTDTITDSLLADGSVTVKGVGEFRVIDDGNEKTVAFRPDQVLAQEVNSPFALFEPVDLSEGVTEELLDGHEGAEADIPVPVAGATKDNTDDNITSTADSEAAVAEDEDTSNNAEGNTSATSGTLPPGIPPVPGSPVVPEMTNIPVVVIGDNSRKGSSETATCPEEVQTESMSQDSVSPTEQNTTAKETSGESYSIHQSLPRQNYEDEEQDGAEELRAVRRIRRGRKETVIIVLIGVLSLLAGILVGHFGIPGLNINGVKSVKITAEEVTLLHEKPVVATSAADSSDIKKQPVVDTPVDSVTAEASDEKSVTDAKPEAPVAKVVTDTVQGSNYLSRIARRHYGKDIFWVYIYEENKDKIHDPNNIRPGTVVVVPPAEKYGINPDSKASIQEAERLSGKILNKES